MKKSIHGILFLFIFTLLSTLSWDHKVYAQEQLVIPNISPYWIKRQSYDNSSSLVLAKNKQAQSNQDSFKGFLTIIPSIAGGGVIALGSILAWLNGQKRRKLFKQYMNDITLLEKDYSSSVLKNPKNRSRIIVKLKEDFSNLKEKADLSAANKAIDDDQRTTIFNTIERKLEEIEKIA